MASLLKKWLDMKPPTSKIVWAEFDGYARKVFANDSADWYADAAGYASAIIQAHSIIPSHCVTFDLLAPFLFRPECTIRSPSELLVQLDNPTTLDFVEDVLNALSHRFNGHVDLILKVQSAADLVTFIDESLECDFDTLDDLSSVTAGLIRRFSDKGVSGLVLARQGVRSISLDEVDAYQPLFSIAEHYDWLTGLEFSGISNGPLEAEGLDADFWLAPDLPVSAFATGSYVKPVGGGLTANFWNGDERIENVGGGFLYGTVPVNCEPESVLSAVRGLSIG
jgi:hypothetical protein